MSFRFPVVEESAELFRILALPTRPPPAEVPDESLAAFLTERLTTTQTPYPGALRPLQAACLKEAWECRGLAGFLRVGAGKSLVGFCLPAILRAKRPLYMAPANMRKDVATEFAKLAKDWHGQPIPFQSYEGLSNPSGGEDLDDSGNVTRQTVLERCQPDLVILDEAHCLASYGAVATKRFRAYMRKHPSTVVIALSGTPFKTSIRDAAHIMDWCLGDQSPLPRPSVAWPELEAWANYLDIHPKGPKTGLGALVHFLTPEERQRYGNTYEWEDKQRIVRRAVARRMYNTPGVISSQESRLVDANGREIGLELRAIVPHGQDAAIDEFFGHLRAGQLPDETPLEDGFAVARHAKTGGNGYYLKWAEPKPPQYWLDARREWAVWCREYIESNRRGIDSAARTARLVERGVVDDEGRLARWEDAQARYKAETGKDEPDTEPVWLSDQAIEAAVDWLRDHTGLVWVDGVEFGQRLSQVTGLPYYREGGRDSQKRHIKDHPPGSSAIASFKSNRVGRNLQGVWHQALWFTEPEEQSLARTHRTGQVNDCRNTLYLGCREHLTAFLRQRDQKALLAEDFTLTPQKLSVADDRMPTLEELESRGGPRWTKPE